MVIFAGVRINCFMLLIFASASFIFIGTEFIVILIRKKLIYFKIRVAIICILC